MPYETKLERAKYMRKWRADNRAHTREYQKEYREKNKQILKETAKKSYLKNKKEVDARQRKWNHDHPEHQLWHSAKRRARIYNLPFTITKKDIPPIPEICPITLELIKYHDEPRKGAHDLSPSLDKIIPELGYVKGNIRIISHKGNRWKCEMTQTNIEQLLKYVKGEA